MRRLPNDLLTVMVVAILSALLAGLLPANSIFRLVCAFPLVFFLPGYAITAALLPESSTGKAERLLFSLGLSVGVTALSGLLLNLTPWGLQTGTWAIMLMVIVLLACAAAWLLPKSAGTSSTAPTRNYFKLRLRDGLLLGLAVLVAGAAVGLTQLPAPPNGLVGYTQLWMVPANPDNINEFRLGLNSSEFTKTRYHLRISVADQVIEDWPELSLKPGETWKTEIKLQTSQVGSGPIVADLYKLDDPAKIYRHVKLWRGEQ